MERQRPAGIVEKMPATISNFVRIAEKEYNRWVAHSVARYGLRVAGMKIRTFILTRNA